MSYEKLLKRIEEEAENTIREARETAEREAAGIRETAEKEIESLRAEARKEAAAEAENRRAVAIKEAKKGPRAVRREMVTQALEAVESRLKSVREEDDYTKLFSLLTAEALKEMDDAAQAIVAPADEEMCRTVLKQHGRTLDVKTSPDIWGGIILATQDGRERLVNTLNSRYDRGRESMLRILAEEMFSADEQK